MVADTFEQPTMAVAHVPEQFGVDMGSFNSVVWSDKIVCVPVPSPDVCV